jgi:N-acetylmuramoyl-L-alanine amidase
MWALVFSLLTLCGTSFAGSFSSLRQSTAPIMVVFPHEGDVIGPASAQFVLGSVSDPKGIFEINGATIPIYKTGAFLAWIPIQSGTFTFHCELKSQAASSPYDRHVFVKPWPAPLPEHPIAIDSSSIAPASSEELRPRDWLSVRFKGSPRGKAWFRLPHHSWMKMREYNDSLGLYEGLYQVAPGENMDPTPIKLYLSGVKVKTRAKVSFRSGPPKIAVINGQNPVMMKAEPEIGEMFPIFPAARVMTSERRGSWTRLDLSGGQSGWVETYHLDFLPENSAPPSAETDVVIVKSLKDGGVVHVGLSERVPFEMEESLDLSRLTVLINYSHIHTNWIVYRDNSFIDQVRIRQKSKDLVELTIQLRPGRKIWGYHASFDGTALSIELRHPPKIEAQALKGRTIFLDPGHMPSAPGAIGGLGTKEMDVNFAIARRVAALLREEGATAVFSRADDEDEVGLIARPRLAWESRADVFVSIHNNNVSAGDNPLKSEHGFSIFYYHPQSLGLARAMHRAYKKLVPLPDEGMRYGNYLVTRMTEMPAILTESAYLSYPDQEADLLNPDFQMKIAHAIVAGIKSFFEADYVAPPVLSKTNLKAAPKVHVILKHRKEKKPRPIHRKKHHG